MRGHRVQSLDVIDSKEVYNEVSNLRSVISAHLYDINAWTITNANGKNICRIHYSLALSPDTVASVTVSESSVMTGAV